ncbi:glycosyltransferase family 4 protein [Segetibacter aerophilus]|uniref:Glycosyl transferase family 1 n=1 Tax=Segetibacter aerophilus TaxID=670293 RepID=A0A512BI38_9BACT|nr:glycosyltransferase family 1 protein [Segetibacter aerophilus]GEO11628.1 hypothetical protein SAE01_41240 [Segetibacter aerophilus]
MKKDIYYDATFQILAPHRGMAKYLNGFLKALSENGEKAQGLAPSGLKRKGDESVTCYGLNNILLWEQLSISSFVKKNKVSYFIFPYNTGAVFSPLSCKSVLILHDLIFMESFSSVPTSKSFRQIVGRFYRRVIVPRIIKKASFIITVSNYSKEQIIRQFNVAEKKICVIPNCIDTTHEAEAHKEKDSEGYFLNVGGDAPHKNTAFLIEAYATLPEEIKKKFSLKVVGISNEANKKTLHHLIRSLHEEHRIIIEKYVNDEQLEKLYRNAFIFIFPSLTEGFGIPLLEAMKCGCSIVCSNTSSMPEVCREAAFYFNPHDTQSFTNAVYLACTDKALRAAKKEEAIKQLDYYSRKNFNKKVADWFTSNIRESIDSEPFVQKD